jgi:cytochrome P450
VYAKLTRNRSNANSVEAAVWFVIEVLRDPELFERIKSEAAESQIPPGNDATVSMFDSDKLCSMPVSQAVYAEVLRLRVCVLILRKAKHDLDFAGWSIKKGERVAAASITRSLDDRIWNTGTVKEPHPLDTFWADRFLVYPNDPNSGPLKNPPVPQNGDHQDEKSTDGPRFSMTGLTNTWMPYSGGARLCPGRHFAKREIIVTAAVMITMFDIELLTPKGWDPQPNVASFGGGTLPVKGKIPCRIRRKKQV